MKRRALRDVIMLLLMTSRTKKHDTGEKNVCLIGNFMKKVDERAFHLINVFNVFFVCILGLGFISFRRPGLFEGQK